MVERNGQKARNASEMASTIGSKFAAFWNHPAGPKTSACPPPASDKTGDPSFDTHPACAGATRLHGVSLQVITAAAVPTRSAIHGKPLFKVGCCSLKGVCVVCLRNRIGSLHGTDDNVARSRLACDCGGDSEGNLCVRGTVFFWAPTMKWGITAANINDFQRPVEGISYPQQLGTAP